MGSRTNFGISTYHHNDLGNQCTIMPSLSMKYFYPENIKNAIIDNVKIDIQKAVEDVSGWEGDSWQHTAQEYLPTIILLQGSGSDMGSFVVNYKIDDKDNIFYRVFSFLEYKEVDTRQIEEDLDNEIQLGRAIIEHSKEHEELIINIMP